ncbi:hypothetical protein ABPG75_006234 [Micractinium tetrahymenae]
MAAPGGSAGPTVERIVSEGVLAAARIIMEARFPTTKRQEQHRPWFNIEVQEVEGAAKALERWRREGPSLPLVLEVFLQPWGAQAAGQDKVETLLERWVVHYYPQLPEGPSHLSRSQLSRLNPQSVYKRLVITLRSLYTYLRVLPAHRMARACKRQRGASFSLGYRLHSTLPGSSAAAAPGARRLQSFRFGVVDTPYGQLRIGVDYQPASTVTILEQTTSPPALPQIIADYVGGDGGGGGGRGEGAARAAARAAGGPGAAASARPLRHAMSASVVSPSQLPQASPPAAADPLAAAQPGSSPQQAAGSLGRAGSGWPIRRSWSTSLRGVSPHRALSQPHSELPSPTTPTAQDAPYGSAPQAVSLPAMLRTLSSSAGRYLVGSPSGRPPLAKPPRTASAAAPVPASGAGSRAAPDNSPASAGRGYMAAAAEEDDAAASPCGSAGSGARQSSKPMCIPGRSGDGFGGGAAGRGRRLRSSNDLWAMQHAAAMHKPLSAPAVSHMQQPAAGAAARSGAAASAAAAAAAGLPGSSRLGASPAGADSSEPTPSPPPARLPILPGTLESESSGSAASSLYPTSCSPQLPFAFTPSAQSLASFGARGTGGGVLQEAARQGPGLDRTSPRLGRTPPAAPGGGGGGLSVLQQAALLQMRAGPAGAGGSGPAPAAAPSPAGLSPGSGGSGGVTAREVPSSIALMRRTSWSSRSSFGPLAGEASQPGVGYSVSPMQDPTLESLLGGSTPRQYSLAAGGLPSPLTAAGVQLPGGPLARQGAGAVTLGFAPASGPPLLTFPSHSPEMSGGLDEADVLPFALDEGSASPFKPRSPAQPSQQQPSSPGDALPISTSARGSPAGEEQKGAPAAGASRPGSSGAAASSAAAEVAAAAAPAVDTDAAVGAFVRLIQEAPPLRLHATVHSGAPGRSASAELAGLAAAPLGTSSGSDSSAATCLSDGRGLTLQAGLRQVSAIRERLAQRGIVVGPCPAEA